MLAHFMVRLYIGVVCSYGEALADRIVSYRIAIFCLISYRIYRFLLWLYRAITNHDSNNDDNHDNNNKNKYWPHQQHRQSWHGQILNYNLYQLGTTTVKPH